MTERQKMLDPASPAASPDDGPRDAGEPAANTEPSQEPSPSPDSGSDPDQTVVILDRPLRRGKTRIDQVTLRKPTVRALRGINLVDLMQLNTQVLMRLLPRISEPHLSEADIERLDPADLTSLGEQAAGFLLPKRVQDGLGI